LKNSSFLRENGKAIWQLPEWLSSMDTAGANPWFKNVDARGHTPDEELRKPG